MGDIPAPLHKTHVSVDISALPAVATVVPTAATTVSKVQSSSSSVSSQRKAQEDLTSAFTSDASTRWKEQLKVGMQFPSLSSRQDSLQLVECTEAKTRHQGSDGQRGEETAPTAIFNDSASLAWRGQPVSLSPTSYPLRDDRAAGTGTSGVAGSIKSNMDDAMRHSSGPLLGAGSIHMETLSATTRAAHSTTAAAPSGSAGPRPRFPSLLRTPVDKSIGLLPQTSQIAGHRTDANSEARGAHWVSRSGRSSSRTPRRFSGSTATSSASETERKSGGRYGDVDCEV